MAPDTAPNGDQDRVTDSAAPRRHRWHEEPGGWSCACGAVCDHEAEPCGRHGECKIGQRREPTTAASLDTQAMSRTLYGHANGDYAFLDTCDGMVPPPTVAHLAYIGPTTDVFALLPRRVRQVDIAAQVGVSQQSVSRYVRGDEPNLTDDGWRALVRLLMPVGADA